MQRSFRFAKGKSVGIGGSASEPARANLLREVFDPKNALSGADIVAFVKNRTGGTVVPRILILTDLRDLPRPKPEEPYVLNLTHDPNRGTHWAVLFDRNDVTYMFDSYQVNLSILPPDWRKRVRRWNACGFQDEDTVVCGHYTALSILYPNIFRSSGSLVKCSRAQSRRRGRTKSKRRGITNDCNVFEFFSQLRTA